MTAEREIREIIPYRTKTITVYEDGKASFSGMLFKDKAAAKDAVDKILSMKIIDTRQHKEKDDDGKV